MSVTINYSYIFLLYIIRSRLCWVQDVYRRKKFEWGNREFVQYKLNTNIRLNNLIQNINIIY